MAVPDDFKGKDLGPRAESVREEIKEECERIEESYIVLAQLLHESVENGYFVRWGYSTFDEYVNEELGISYRKAAYLVQIANVVKNLKIDWHDIEGIGWTRMRTIVPALKQDGVVGDWLELAGELSVKDLEKLVKDNKIGAEISSSGGDAVVTLKFRVTKEQSDIIMDALSYAKRSIDAEDDVMALEQMAFDYIMKSGADPERVNLEDICSWVEQQYGVELAVMSREEIANMAGETNENAVGQVQGDAN